MALVARGGEESEGIKGVYIDLRLKNFDLAFKLQLRKLDFTGLIASHDVGVPKDCVVYSIGKSYSLLLAIAAALYETGISAFDLDILGGAFCAQEGAIGIEDNIYLYAVAFNNRFLCRLVPGKDHDVIVFPGSKTCGGKHHEHRDNQEIKSRHTTF